MKVHGRVLHGALSLNPYELMKALAPFEGQAVELEVRATNPDHTATGADHDCGSVLVPIPLHMIDGCIVSALLAVWSAGYKTLGCCCGHGQNAGGIITINSGTFSLTPRTDTQERYARIHSEAQPASPSRPEPRCSSATARWCPVHGDCKCPKESSDMDDPACPLHALKSTHARRPEQESGDHDALSCPPHCNLETHKAAYLPAPPSLSAADPEPSDREIHGTAVVRAMAAKLKAKPDSAEALAMKAAKVIYDDGARAGVPHHRQKEIHAAIISDAIGLPSLVEARERVKTLTNTLRLRCEDYQQKLTEACAERNRLRETLAAKEKAQRANEDECAATIERLEKERDGAKAELAETGAQLEWITAAVKGESVSDFGLSFAGVRAAVDLRSERDAFVDAFERQHGADATVLVEAILKANTEVLRRQAERVATLERDNAALKEERIALCGDAEYWLNRATAAESREAALREERNALVAEFGNVGIGPYRARMEQFGNVLARVKTAVWALDVWLKDRGTSANDTGAPRLVAESLRAALSPARAPIEPMLDSPDSVPPQLREFEARGFERINRHAPIEPAAPEKEPQPRIVCLCGSTRFIAEERATYTRESLTGNIVLTHSGVRITEEMDPALKPKLDRLHFHKIDLADEILVLNVGGYVGDSTRREIEYAREKGKPVRWLEPAPQGAAEEPR